MSMVPYTSADLALVDDAALFSADLDSFMEEVWVQREVRLRRFREDEDLSQTEIAERIGRSQMTVSRWLTRFDIATKQLQRPKVNTVFTPPDDGSGDWEADEYVPPSSERMLGRIPFDEDEVVDGEVVSDEVHEAPKASPAPMAEAMALNKIRDFLTSEVIEELSPKAKSKLANLLRETLERLES